MDNLIESSSKNREDVGALDQSTSISRKLYFWWWKYVMYPPYAAELVSMTLLRLYVAAHFPHESLIGALLGAFCIYVTDPFNWKYGYSMLERALCVTPTVAATPPMVPEEEVVMLDKEYYDMSGEKILIILNQRKFMKTRHFKGKPSFRRGTNVDKNRLKTLYEQLGFKVIVMNNHQYHSIIQKLRTIAARDHTRTSCICVAILTHGNKGGQICAADRWYLLSEVMNIFANVTSLVGKPKIYFVQACRGTRRDAGKTVHVSRQSNGVLTKPTSPKPSSRDSLEADADSTDRFDSQSNGVFTVPSHADYLVLYACAKAYVSHRYSTGSWMIQALCRQIEDFHKNEHILDIITRVHKEVAGKTSQKNKKQMPETRHTLTRKFKF